MGRVIVIHRYGGPDELTLSQAPDLPLRDGELRIRTLAAAVNHTDLKIRAGHWPVRQSDPFPYVPGVEAVGVVEEASRGAEGFAVGDRVITMMQGLGGVRAERQGAYAEFVTVRADAVTAIPPAVDPLAVAALGLVAVTALEGLSRLGDLTGKDVLISGAGGGVGSAAVTLAKARRARVIALVSRPDQTDYARGLGADEVRVWPRNAPPPAAAGSVDGILDVVAGPGFAPLVSALRPGGVLSLVGAVDGGDVSFDAWSLIAPVVLTGYSTETLDGPALRDAVGCLCAWLIDGTIRPPNYQCLPLGEAAQAHTLLEAGGTTGRILLVP